MSDYVPRGFRVAGVHCGIKRNPHKQDVALVVSDQPATGVGVYTQNLFRAAPVLYNQRRTPGANLRGIVVNSGNANACTGARGLVDAEAMARDAAAAVGAQPDEMLVLSTGIIGEFLPLQKISSGITAAAAQLGAEEKQLVAAARGFMTTDTRHKVVQKSMPLNDGGTCRATGIAKGAAMIGPNMATMLGVILTDGRIDPEPAQRMLRSAVDRSFNCISVEGHMSTNDTVLLLANGAAGGDVDEAAFATSLDEICTELAREIVDDGEGATHLMTIEVEGAARPEDARRIGKTVGESALVKTAIAGADPNWGRIVSAVGYAGVPLEPEQLRLWVNGTLLFEHGAPAPFDAAAVSESIRGQRETAIRLVVGDGGAAARFWTCDLTAEYVRLNADYHT